ncbi:PAS domain S-box protein [Mariprofundus sp. NF]|uniref:PAS domain-containing protein n=1 Tax=Mariprofundus sp. NF TaxID=2608716 RepID=UPI0015A01988|nr:PAS domain S-box protein [Mariprofundus sp. NF]NWF38521.1 PAS domain S-box protein [Mariprofundus sp. NF]
MTEQEKQLSSGEIKELQERAKKLAMEKSYLQLVQQMITSIGESSGLENVIQSMLTNTMNVVGGSNLKIYYKIDEQLYYADVMGESRELETFPDEVIARVYNSGQAEELEAEFDQTRLQTPKFTKAYTWIYPLLANNEVIAVCRLENLSMDLQQIYGQLPAFFNFSAMVLKNEILGHSHLQKLNEQLEVEVTERKARESDLKQVKITLEQTVEKRTAELKEKSDELNLFFSSALDLLCIADSEGYFRKLNPEWEKALGYPLRELEGRKFLELIHPDDLESTLQAIATLSAQHPLLNFSNRYRHKDGSYRWLEWRSHPVGDKIYASARDITELKLAEEEIRRFNSELEQIVEERTEKLNETNKRLESFNELMAEREMRVVEVKQEVNLLSQKLGQPMPYKEVWDALQE